MQFQHEFVLSLLLTCNTTEISNRNEKKKHRELEFTFFAQSFWKSPLFWALRVLCRLFVSRPCAHHTHPKIPATLSKIII